MEFVLRRYHFVTEVSVPTIETIKLVFKPVFLKQFHFLTKFGYLYDTFDIGEKGMSAKKVTLRDANEDDRIIIEVQKTSEKRTYTRFLTSFNTKH